MHDSQAAIPLAKLTAVSRTFSIGGLNRRFWRVAEARKREGSAYTTLASSCRRTKNFTCSRKAARVFTKNAPCANASSSDYGHASRRSRPWISIERSNGLAVKALYGNFSTLRANCLDPRTRPEQGFVLRLSCASDRDQATSSVKTLKLARLHGPNEVTIATSVASRPRAIKMRPMRG